MTIKPYSGRHQRSLREHEGIVVSRHSVRLDIRIHQDTLDELNARYMAQSDHILFAEFLRYVIRLGIKALP